mmetsp:Transcript_78583/g.243805  ORF Transcript_78583/g.243805 Transcript_78583/m.243805 type:complete len:435 (+) Transcript_78583:498-1802(+)
MAACHRGGHQRGVESGGLRRGEDDMWHRPPPHREVHFQQRVRDHHGHCHPGELDPHRRRAPEHGGQPRFESSSGVLSFHRLLLHHVFPGRAVVALLFRGRRVLLLPKLGLGMERLRRLPRGHVDRRDRHRTRAGCTGCGQYEQLADHTLLPHRADQQGPADPAGHPLHQCPQDPRLLHICHHSVRGVGAGPSPDRHVHLRHSDPPELHRVPPRGCKRSTRPPQVLGLARHGGAHALRVRHRRHQLVRGRRTPLGGPRLLGVGVHRLHLPHHVRRLQRHHGRLLPQRHRDRRARPGACCAGSAPRQEDVRAEGQEALPGGGRRPVGHDQPSGAAVCRAGREHTGHLRRPGPGPHRHLGGLQAHRGEEQLHRPGRLRGGLPAAAGQRAARGHCQIVVGVPSSSATHFSTDEANAPKRAEVEGLYSDTHGGAIALLR